MHRSPTSCPVCGGDLIVTSLACRECDTRLEGRFENSTFSQLNDEQLAFVELFIKNEGKITRMEADLELSYPTIRNRLMEIIRALGYEPGEDEFAGLSDEERKRILDDLDAGKINYEEALHLIQQTEGG
ncbi:MAG TPA: DUF2089 domain-containing protein [Anaerolineales bacterium]|jgi:hypothetical protein|nr:DUF2089 domain-containing protein [Anaerolineales bacterium]